VDHWASMKLFFDFLPIILFFGVFKFADMHAEAAALYATAHLGFAVSGGKVGVDEAPVLLATVVVMVATMV
jgi:intracellular septation protein